MEVSRKENGSGKPPNLRAVVEAYMVHRLDTSIHPSYPAIQRIATVSSQRPDLVSVVSAPEIPITPGQEAIPTVRLSFSGELYKDAEAESRRFQSAIEEYLNTIDKSTQKSLQINQGAKSWDEVLDNVEKMALQYNNPTGFMGKCRKAVRRLGGSNGSMSAWLALLPAQSQYASVVCGGLSLILGAAARLEELRGDIEHALLDIPTRLSLANRTLNVFDESSNLHRSSANLFVAVIALLDHILQYFKAKLSKKLLSTILKQSDYQRVLSDKLEDLKDCLEQFNSIALNCSFEVQQDTRRQVSSLRQESEDRHSEIGSHLYLSRREQFQQYSHLDNRFEAVVTELEQVKEQFRNMCDFFGSSSRLDPRTQDCELLRVPLKRVLSAPELKQMRDALRDKQLGLLNYNESIAQADIQRNLRSVWTMPRAAQDRVISIVRDRRLQDWITERSSSALFLNGNHSMSSPQNPTSFVCAKLLASTEPQSSAEPGKSRNTFAVSFFCAEHLRSSDPYHGAIGIIQSIVAQVLICYDDFNLDTIRQLSHVNFDDLDGLCDIFEILLSQLPRRTVLFCVIDGITSHEDSEVRREDVGAVLQRLIELAEQDFSEGCTFKLLITSPRLSRIYQRKLKTRENVLTMPAKLASQGGFSNAKWTSALGHDGGAD
ncbi:hypothetical protein EJ04DRAFT_447810 [Polyplosphaeria fusca]|uniref:Fungal STAND N-terminal Goodbye domain-containing protein n=1 Tax=Polyplosphaeria fusca TaxID=682080 RepID=A0A9P4QMP4_9PLEO|nr:hypothetical protein EJ04DRAFT_447810 [Polyplosphaeria fusca]